MLGSVFDAYAVKTVTPNDKRKNAYVVVQEQREIMELAGLTPSSTKPNPTHTLKVLGSSFTSVHFSYYVALRKGSAPRQPEPRMGLEIISGWLEVDDQLLLGVVDNELFAMKLPEGDVADGSVIGQLAARASNETIRARALKAKGPPRTVTGTSTTFIRDPYVTLEALARAAGQCQMPGCSSQLFKRDDGSPYLEVHHLTPLSEDGFDELDNVAALCPACHREMHHGIDRMHKRLACAKFVAAQCNFESPD